MCFCQKSFSLKIHSTHHIDEKDVRSWICFNDRMRVTLIGSGWWVLTPHTHHPGVSPSHPVLCVCSQVLTCAKSLQLCSTLCHPMDCSLPGSSVLGIVQARILERVAIPFSRGSFPTQGTNPGLLHYRQILYHLSH